MTSVINALARALDAFPNRVALRFLDYSDGTVTVRSHTYRQLWDEIAVAAAHLPGTPGDRVLPLIPGDDRLLILILGAMYRGMIPIPVPFPITRGPETERLHHIITDSSPTVVIADDTTATSLDLASLTPSSQILSPDKLTEPTDVDEPVPTGPDTPAFLQYTSGSTGHPKGVLNDHRALAYQAEFVANGLEPGELLSMVSWLPLHHDMGLIYCLVSPSPATPGTRPGRALRTGRAATWRRGDPMTCLALSSALHNPLLYAVGRVQTPTAVVLGLPHAGGTCRLFLGWERLVPHDTQLLALRYPGREARLTHAPFRRMSDLVEQILSATLFLEDMDLYLFGHSMGALVGYAVCQEMKAQGRRAPSGLVVSSSRPPWGVPDNAPIHTRSDASLCEELLALDGTPPEVLKDPAQENSSCPRCGPTTSCSRPGRPWRGPSTLPSTRSTETRILSLRTTSTVGDAPPRVIFVHGPFPAGTSTYQIPQLSPSIV